MLRLLNPTRAPDFLLISVLKTETLCWDQRSRLENDVNLNICLKSAHVKMEDPFTDLFPNSSWCMDSTLHNSCCQWSNAKDRGFLQGTQPIHPQSSFCQWTPMNKCKHYKGQGFSGKLLFLNFQILISLKILPCNFLELNEDQESHHRKLL